MGSYAPIAAGRVLCHLGCGSSPILEGLRHRHLCVSLVLSVQVWEQEIVLFLGVRRSIVPKDIEGYRKNY